jgi:hypothetical protein
MSDPQILSTLRRKRDEIEAAIVTYESKVEDAKPFNYPIVRRRAPGFGCSERLAAVLFHRVHERASLCIGPRLDTSWLNRSSI